MNHHRVHANIVASHATMFDAGERTASGRGAPPLRAARSVSGQQDETRHLLVSVEPRSCAASDADVQAVYDSQARLTRKIGRGLLVFVIGLGFYVTPALLGSPAETMISQTIMIEANENLDYERASAAGVLLLLWWWWGRRYGRDEIILDEREWKGRSREGREREREVEWEE